MSFFLSFESKFNIRKGTYFGEISKKKGLGKFFFWGGGSKRKEIEDFYLKILHVSF